MGQNNSTESDAYTHAHPKPKPHTPSNNHTNIKIYNAQTTMPPKSLQRLHCQCTVDNCGKNFDNIADLDNHMNTTHAEILDIPVSLAQGESQEFATRMMHGAIITTVVRDIETSSTNGAKKEHEHEHVHPPTPPAEEEISAVLGKGKEKATEARPKLARWASNMNRNAIANPEFPRDS